MEGSRIVSATFVTVSTLVVRYEKEVFCRSDIDSYPISHIDQSTIY